MVDILLVDKVEGHLRQEVARLVKTQKTRLPQERSLAQNLGVSVNTVRSALMRLKKDRLVRSVRGKGTYAVPAPKKTQVVMVIGDDPHHPYQMLAAGVLSSVLKERGYISSLEISSKLTTEWNHLVERHENLCGAILVGIYTRSELTDLVGTRLTPIVYVGDLKEEVVRGSAVCDTILPDNRALGYAAANYLIQAGHRNIVLCGWGLHQAFGRDLIQGCAGAFEAHGLTFRDDRVVNLPKVPFGTANEADALHRPIGEFQKEIQGWFESSDPPTALIHNSGSEVQLRDVVRHYFHDRFKMDSIVGITYQELLSSAYTGYGEAILACASFQSIAKRAVELLFRGRGQKHSPIREMQEHIRLFRRIGHVWEETEVSRT